MACACTSTSSYSLTSRSYMLLVLLLLGLNSRICHGLGSFGFDIHHRFSDPVKQILGFEGLPEKGSVEYYVAMTHRDSIIRGRHLAASNNQSPAPLTFANGNDTINGFDFLYYANVSVGTPSVSYLVALDTGSRLFWLPCDCNNSTCETSLQTPSGQVLLNFNIYSPNASSTSNKVSCNSSIFCDPNQCTSANSDCAYSVAYYSNMSTSGILVEDVLHLITDDDQSKVVDAPITLGCGKNETGAFLNGFAPNGLLGLDLDNISVPSTIARKGLGPNSFSMCFGSDGTGRINFGDNGTSEQKETSFTVEPSNANQSSPMIPIILTMKGGEQYYLTNPTTEASSTKGGYCLAILKSPDINLIGQNFMTGYRIVFNRDKMILGWKPSNCYDDSNLNTSTISPSHSPTASPSRPSVSPAASPSSPSVSPATSPAFTCTIMMIFVSVLAIV
ncbi:hypothetical protein ACB092_02G243000 [Castanea dentata]